MRADLEGIRARVLPDDLVRIVAHAIDRPVLEAMIAKIARGKPMDLRSRSREDLAHAALTFAAREKAIKKQLETALYEATRLERAKLAQLQDDWRVELDVHLQQRRTSAKFMLAMAVAGGVWFERLASVVEMLRTEASARSELQEKAEAAGIGESLRTLEKSFEEAASSKGTLEAQVAALESERAAVIVELGKREQELKHAREHGEALSRELERLQRSGADAGERDALKQKVRKLEKVASFAQDRERDRERLRHVEQERDVLQKELALVRVQLQLAQLNTARLPSPPPPEPERTGERRSAIRRKDDAPKVEAPKTYRSALYVDGANVAGAARLLYDRKVDFSRLRDLLLGRETAASLSAYVIDNGDERFDAFMRSLKREGYRVQKRAPKQQPDGTVKADMDVHITVDVMAERDRHDRVVLVTGDSDFIPLVKRLKSEGIRVEAAAFRARAANELIAAVDAFIPLDEKVLT